MPRSSSLALTLSCALLVVAAVAPRASIAQVECGDSPYVCPEKCCGSSGDYSCCPSSLGANAVCCSDGEHCCPEGYTCDVPAQMCVKDVAGRLVAVPFLEADGPAEEAGPPAAPEQSCTPTTCPLGETCCTYAHSLKCCTYEDGVCCANGQFCCPSGYICDDPNGRCISPGGKMAVPPTLLRASPE